MRLPSLAFACGLSAAALLACSSSGDSGSGEPAPGGAPAPSGTTTAPAPPPSAPSGPKECAPPPSPAPAIVQRSASPQPITVPATVRGTTSDAIDFQHFTFTLADVAKLHLEASIGDFDDGTEKTGVGIEVRRKTGDVNTALVSAHVDPSTAISKGDSSWLFPGDYEVILSRSTYASANENIPTRTHAYEFTLTETLGPEVKDGCTFPASFVSPTDVNAYPECDAWCKKLPACHTSCVDDCTIKVGQCAESTRKYLDCLATTGKVSCVTGGGATGYSVDSSCEIDASVCAPGTKRK